MQRSVALFIVVLAMGELTEAQTWEQVSGGIYYNGGNVGIGTSTPTYPLQVKGGIEGETLFLNGAPDLSVANPTLFISKITRFFGPPPADLDLRYFLYFDASKKPVAFVHDSGRTYFGGPLGIGTTDPSSMLEVAARKDRNGVTGSTTTDGFYGVVGQADEHGWGGLFQFGHDGRNAVYLGGNGTAANFAGPVSVSGQATVSVLEITGGMDIAEPFRMDQKEEVPEGAVVVIDEEHPGDLKLSTRPYDSRVAGIVSGARGIRPGISLRQGSTEGKNVALSGRVYVLGDATGHAIRPGDLLTTSSRPGYCMKAADHARAEGAIIGKAMSNLDSGTGLVLVLVSLQ